MSKPSLPFDAIHARGNLAGGGEAAGSREMAAEPERVYDERATNRAWESFLSSGSPALSSGSPACTKVRRVIERSWQRSVECGVNSRGRGSTLISSQDDLIECRQKNEDLLAAATETVRGLASMLGDAATMVIVTDDKGVILDAGGDRRTIEAGRDIRLEVGAAWNESITGTNGIGTALVTGQPVYVHAAEHFCEGVKAWTCVGAPIRNPLDRSVIGVIDFSGPQEIFHRYNVALAVMAANHIEFALSERMQAERTFLLEACINQMPRVGGTEGIVILDRFGRVVHHNDLARQRWCCLVKEQDLHIGAKLVRSGLQPGKCFAQHLPEGLRDQGIEPLIVDGTLKGMVLVLGAKPKPKSVASRDASAKGSAIATARSAIIGTSEALLHAVEKAERAAHGKVTILLEGETGVGKELFARLIHAAGQETGREPFVAFNCGAVSKELLGGELFGHAPGAFTGSTREGRAGRFETASGGVLSLDEIGEMPLELQPYLLRVIEERAVYRLGDCKPRPVQVRLVASTNRNLRQEVAEGRFRKDLFFRISAVRIAIPPLRERPGDIDALVDYFNAECAASYGSSLLLFDEDARALLRRYDWPGNVRELRNVVESLSLMSTSRVIRPADLPEDILDVSLPASPDDAIAGETSGPLLRPGDITRLDDMERQTILRAVDAAGGNISLAAQKIGVSRSTLYRKMQQYRTGN
jgi:sigma-54 dependent transcriptional regulator, acetoin dehydrogenase operon transcriptional activator AcoR